MTFSDAAGPPPMPIRVPDVRRAPPGGPLPTISLRSRFTMPCDWTRTPVSESAMSFAVSRTGWLPEKLLPASHSKPMFAPVTSFCS